LRLDRRTEPFAEWVISGRFLAGRPAWESAGARLVEDITPYEQRKLWLLNASHPLIIEQIEALTEQR
jgi:fructuronate reductase